MSAIRPTAAVLPRNAPLRPALACCVQAAQTEPHAAPALPAVSPDISHYQLAIGHLMRSSS